MKTIFDFKMHENRMDKIKRFLVIFISSILTGLVISMATILLVIRFVSHLF